MGYYGWCYIPTLERQNKSSNYDDFILGSLLSNMTPKHFKLLFNPEPQQEGVHCMCLLYKQHGLG